jgi:hypothetical protein
MQRIISLRHSVRAFWADSHQRKTLMWVLAALGALIAIYGAYTAIDGHRDYTKLSDKIADISARKDAFVQQYLVEVDGEMKFDTTKLTQADLMVLGTITSQENQTKAQRVDADNQRRDGVRLLGIGVIGLALAYIVSPDKPQPSPDEASAPPGASDETTA